jgi:hypothetical protein
MTDNVIVTQNVQSVIVTNQQPNVIVAAVGPQGPSGSTTIFYTHNQATPAATWTINHNLNGHPTAVVFDSANTQVEGTFSYPSTDQMLINFSSAFSGTAYVI